MNAQQAFQQAVAVAKRYTAETMEGAGAIKGDPGFSPAVNIENISGGHKVTITDANGAQSFDVMNGTADIAQGTMGIFTLSEDMDIQKDSILTVSKSQVIGHAPVIYPGNIYDIFAALIWQGKEIYFTSFIIQKETGDLSQYYEIKLMDSPKKLTGGGVAAGSEIAGGVYCYVYEPTIETGNIVKAHVQRFVGKVPEVGNYGSFIYSKGGHYYFVTISVTAEADSDGYVTFQFTTTPAQIDGGGSGGVTDYADLDGKPQINGVTLQGNMTSEELGIPGMDILNQSAGTPVGEIISFMGTTAPQNYLICDGAQYPIADYPYLAQHFIDNFGSEYYFGGADGTFAVPDLRGEFLRGTGTNGHENQGNGAGIGQHQNATVIPNVQSTSSGTEYLSGYESKSNYAIAANVDHSYVTESGQSVNKTRVSSQTAKDVNEKVMIKYTSRPTNTSVLYCIKCKPTFFIQVQGE